MTSVQQPKVHAKSESHGAKRLVISIPRRSATAPTISWDPNQSRNPQSALHLKRVHRTATIVDENLYLPSSPSSGFESAETIPGTPPPPYSGSPLPIYTSRCSTPISSASFGYSVDKFKHGEYFPHESKCSPKSVLKHLELPKTENLPSLFDENTPIEAASAALENVLYDLITCVKRFKCPSELDFSGCIDIQNPLLLPLNPKNESFIHQLRGIDKLRARLAEIPTHGSPWLEDKHQATSAAIERTLLKMREDQLQLYDRFVKAAVESANDSLVQLFTDLNDLVQKFKLPLELDFSGCSEDNLVLPRTEINRPFIYQFSRLDDLQTRLVGIPTHGEKELEDKHRAIGMAIAQSLRRMEEYQLNLYKNYERVKLPDMALDRISCALHQMFNRYMLPSELHFPASTNNHPFPLPNKKNMPFINRLRALERMQNELNTISTNGNEQLEEKYREIHAAIEQALHTMQKHQAKLYKRARAQSAAGIVKNHQ